MSANLDLINNLEITVRGKTISVWQGTADDSLPADVMRLSVDGNTNYQPFTIGTGVARELWNSSEDKPADFDFMFFVADQNMFLQVICTATNFIVPVLAGVPFVLAPKTDALTAKALAAANTTAISGTAPTVTAIAKIVVQNNSGETATGFFFLAD